MSIVEADEDQRLRVEWLYDVCGYRGGLSDTDIVLAALSAQRLLGAVRLCREQGVFVLRGMQVQPDFRRIGIGTKLLRACERRLGNRTCYSIPWRHLEGFYGAAGFHVCEPARAPEFLALRHSRYLTSGMNVVLMVRL